MLTLKQDTMAYQLGARRLVLPTNMGDAYLPDVIAALSWFYAGNHLDEKFPASAIFQGYPMKGNPEQDALLFYLMNHAVGLLRSSVHPYESLGQSVLLMEEYHNVLAFLGSRMFYYLLLICTRESRHCHAPQGESISAFYGDEIKAFHLRIKGKSSQSAAEELMNRPPKVKIGVFTTYLVAIFAQGSYSGGYGGKAWAQVAEVLDGFVNGKISAELMMDTAFTLCHNNGPIFNKGMLFESYSDTIYKILDVQRSGQIPQLISSNGVYLSLLVQRAFVFCKKFFQLDGYVDWFVVEQLGSKKKYPTEKAAQVAVYGASKKATSKSNPKPATVPGINDSIQLTHTMSIKKVNHVR